MSRGWAGSGEEIILVDLHGHNEEEDMFEKIKELCALDPTLIWGAGLALGTWIVIGVLHLRDHLADKKRWKGGLSE